MPGSSYVGKAGHLAVMGELALRGYNVAMPEMDIGDDLFVVNDATGAMWRIQVKTSVARVGVKVISGQFRVRQTAITMPMNPDLHFVFAMRINHGWRYLVMSRQVLANYVQANNLGTQAIVQGVAWRQLYISINKNTGVATCSGQVLTHLLENWGTWPEL